jgi:cytoskeletal protein CcmA (bactofilin family)
MKRYEIKITHTSGKLKGKSVSYYKKNIDSALSIAKDAILEGDVVELHEYEIAENFDTFFCNAIMDACKELA